MRERTLGFSGLRVSLVGLGCNAFGWRLDEQDSLAVIAAALDAGISFFDTAESYGEGASESFLGRALAGQRERVVIGTKFGWSRTGPGDETPRGSRAYIRRALEGSLRRLGTDHIDLYQYHRPDEVTPIAETLGALNELVGEGKVLAIGSSQFSAVQVREADAAARAAGLTRFVSAQNHYSLLEREVEAELVPACEELGLGLIPFFPLARGLLTGKYHRGEPGPEGALLTGELELPDERWTRLEGLETFARDEGVSLLSVAIGGLAAQPAVATVIAGASRPEQARANAAAAEWEPSQAALARLRAL